MLYIVSTPIGNLGDMTVRAIEVLKSVDFIAAEDTRVAAKLLSFLGIEKQVISYYEHNRAYRGAQIISRLLAGESCALTTDAGTPCVSDPGSMLVRQCRESGIEVTAVPGACAAVCAYSLSGLESGRFCFEGFLSVNRTGRREHLESLKNEKRPMIFYEAPHKLRSTLADFLKVFGPDRRITIARELTKLHEEVIPLTVSEAVSLYEEKDPRGEYVLILEGAPDTDPLARADEALDLARGFTENGMSTRDAANEASKITGVPKNNIYSRLL